MSFNNHDKSNTSTTTSIDLMYLTNKSRNSIQSTTKQRVIVDRKDVSFYRKRIFQMCKDLLRNNTTNPILKDSFDEFCKTAIEHFKITDKTEIIQNEYKHLNVSDSNSINTSTIPNDTNPDELMFKRIEKPGHTMDKFIINHVVKKEDDIHIPIQKKYNLKDIKYQDKDVSIKSKTSAEVMSKKKKKNKKQVKKQEQLDKKNKGK